MAVQTIELAESFDQQGLALEEEHGQPVLRHVKILGSISQNGRFYTPEAKSAAIPMYESVKVNLDHPENPQKTRGIRDRFGKLVHIRIEGGDLYGDLLFNPHHELAESVKWYAKNMPDCLGLSHNAVGQGREENGKFIVDKIVKLRSVDLVADPATTMTLFESKEEQDQTTKGAAANEKPVVTSPTPPPNEVPSPTETAPSLPASENWDAFDKEMGGLVRKLLQNKELTVAQKRKSLLTALKLLGEEEKELKKEEKQKETETKEHVVDTQPTVDPIKQLMESIQSELGGSKQRISQMTQKVLQYEKAAKRQDNSKKAEKLLLEAKLPKEAVTQYFRDRLAAASDEKEMRDLIEDRRLMLATEAPAPKSQPRPDLKDIKDEDVAALLRGRASKTADAFN